MTKYAGVFIGAQLGAYPEYIDVTKQLAHELVVRNSGVVYGGASVGLMGVLADTMLGLNADVIGVITSVLMQQEISHLQLTRLHQVETMQERKKMLAELADFFIIMPGGLGTLEEFFEIWNAAKIGLHQKPIGLLNVNGYFNHLVKFIEDGINAGFVKSSHLELLAIASNPKRLLDKMKVV